MSPIILIAVFIVSTVLGYLIIRQVPSLLHTPLMSGMNALSGVTVVGAIRPQALLCWLMTDGWPVRQALSLSSWQPSMCLEASG